MAKIIEKDRIKLIEMFQILIKSFKIGMEVKTPISILLIPLGFAAAFFPLIIAQTLNNLTNIIVKLYSSDPNHFLEAIRIFSLLSILYIIQALYLFIENYFRATETIRIKEYIKEKILRIICSVKYKYIENFENFRENINFTETVAGKRVANSIQVMVMWLQSVVTFIIILKKLMSINLWIVILLIVTCIPAIILSYNQKDEEYRFKTKWMKEGAMVIHYYGMCCAPDSMNDLRHWRIYNFIKKGWKNVAKKYINKKNEITKKYILHNTLADILRNSVFIGVLLLVTNEIFRNPELGLGTYMLVLTLAGDFQKVTTKIFVVASEFLKDIKYMRDFFNFETYEKEEKSTENKPIKNLEIEFSNVSFKYSDTKRLILKNINIKIKEGEKIAIVGENGSGKTTFVNLLCGIHAPNEGSIMVDGKDIFKNIATFRKNISVVFQDFSRYEATIKDNIIISDFNKELNENDLIKICEITGVDEIINKQKNGLDEMIGIFSEQGNNLSGGQWQKIALARAAYRTETGVKILDEPTAALDPISEANLYKNFVKLTGNNTVILISHRLGICSIVDRILVFKDGQIIGDGNHETLIKQNEYYNQLYNSQLKWYK